MTEDEKRAAAGYGPHSDGASDTPSSISPSPVGPEAQKYSPDQPRVPAGSSDGGQWTDGGGGGDGGGIGDNQQEAGLRDLLGRLLRAASKAPKILKPSEKPLHDLMKPGGKELGVAKGSAGEGIRTTSKSEFGKLKSELLDGAVEVPARGGYIGKWFQRPDGSIFGIRNSEKYGETIDVVKSIDQTVLKNGYKVHGE